MLLLLQIQTAQLADNMKLQLFALVLLIAGIYAFPSEENNFFDDEPIQRNPAEDRVRNMVERIIRRIKNAGLDPLNVEKRQFSINPSFIDVRLIGVIEKLHFSGLSDIRINYLEYSYIFNRLRIDVSIPEMKVSMGNCNFQGIIAGNAVKGEMSGSLSINELRIQGVVYVDVNIIGQPSIRSISLDSSLKGIEADLKAMAQGVDRTEYVNNLFNVRIPAFLKNNKDDIDRILGGLVKIILEYYWSN